MTICVGVDAGKTNGVAILSVLSNGTATLSSPPCTIDQAKLVDFVTWALAAFEPKVITIEVPSGTNYGSRPNTMQLLNARGVGERLAGFCEARGFQVITCSASETRRALGCCGTKAEKADHATARVLKMRVPGWPRSNSHERDAAIAAIFGAMKITSQRRSA